MKSWKKAMKHCDIQQWGYKKNKWLNINVDVKISSLTKKINGSTSQVMWKMTSCLLENMLMTQHQWWYEKWEVDCQKNMLMTRHQWWCEKWQVDCQKIY